MTHAASMEGGPASPDVSYEQDYVEFRTGVSYPVIPGELSFAVHANQAETQRLAIENPSTMYFTSRAHTEYNSYCQDFGPVDLGMVVSFCHDVRALLGSERAIGRHLVFYSELDFARRTNSAFLLAAYLVLVKRWSPEVAAAPFLRIQPSPFKAFRDATDLPSDFDLTLLDCLRGLARGYEQGWFDLEDFDGQSFRLWDEAGISRICPKFVAFKGPVSGPSRPHYAEAPEAYVPLLRQANVGTVIRLNDASTYSPVEFERAGFVHCDMGFEDCSVPSTDIIMSFIEACKAEPRAVGVHCLAGLGRTGTLIAVWLMSAYGWGARETIGWLRLCRPGSVIGEQQHFLLNVERSLGRHAAHAEQPAPAPPQDSVPLREARAGQVTAGLAKRQAAGRRPSTCVRHDDQCG